MVLAGGLSALALAGGSDTVLAVGARLAALALVALLAAVVLGWASLVPVALLLVGAAYATRLSVDDPALDGRAPFLAGGLLLAAELAYWSLEERVPLRSEPGESLRRLGLAILLALAGLAVAAVLLALADLARTGGLGVDLLGAAAAAGALLVLVLLARRPVQT